MARYPNHCEYKMSPHPLHLERVKRFITERCTENPISTVPFSVLWSTWSTWQDLAFPFTPNEKFQRRSVSRCRFSICVQHLGYPSVRDTHARHAFGGLALKE